MNQEVYKGIVKALTDWQSESRNYTFETRVTHQSNVR